MRRFMLVFVALDGFAHALLGQSSDQFALVRGAMHRLVDSMGSPSVAVAVAKQRPAPAEQRPVEVRVDTAQRHAG